MLRAGLALKLEDLKKIGRPALLMAFIPATFEIIGIVVLASLLFSLSLIESLILGGILAAVSPAIIVPKMIKLIESGYGNDKKIPHLILAGASLDDVFVIILFTSFLHSMIQGDFNLELIYQLPLSIILGVGLGLLLGYLFVTFFNRFHMRDTIKVRLLFSVAFLLVVVEEQVKAIVLMSGLLGIMIMGGIIRHRYPVLAKSLVSKFEKIWVLAEIMLFVLVGAIVDISVIPSIGFNAILLIFGALMFRLLGVSVALIKTSFNIKEKLFIGFSYLPKATVQAAIGAIPLSLGFQNGYLMLTVAVLAILITAPLGAISIDLLYTRLLTFEIQEKGV